MEPELGSAIGCPDILADKLHHDPTLVSWAPLLRDVSVIAPNETPLTAQITGAGRGGQHRGAVREATSLPTSPARDRL